MVTHNYDELTNAFAIACDTSSRSGNDANTATRAGVHAVIAAFQAQLGEQGLVVVRADELARLCELAKGWGHGAGDHDLIARCTALAAPDDGRTGR